MKGTKWDTKHWVIHNAVDKTVENLVKHPHIQEAAQWINRDELVAFPTETVYGLGANALSNQASMKIFEAKGRPSDNPLIVHIAHLEQLDGVVDNIPPLAEKLMKTCWPGPLTLVLAKGRNVCQTVTADLSTVAVRMPDHPVALALILASGKPLAAPSANRSGKPSPTSAEHVLHDLNGRISGVLDGGMTGVGVESTVVDVTEEIPMILRPGGVTKEQLEQIVGEVRVDPALQAEGLDVREKPRSPGVKYQHYAPEGDMWLVGLEQGLEWMQQKIRQLVREDRLKGYRVGVLTTDEGMSGYEADTVLSVGKREDLSTVTQRIYHVLREFDQQGTQRIYAETFPIEGLGAAVMNRLHKAAGGKVIRFNSDLISEK
ncbi:L-threonylcarbamoyladenylate synthase [Caldalkalibacillus mannanilyticus]|uniref:L-threonylcarbamoyladenylate synthase n=1 Tax=Caldalkalibacillus mannanilyticus TaxID=1418 RepID=UPI000469B1CE|nr:L-threonylcarbamoyladenylate synthase [Caldalkalibacillus mannanilyticus]